MAAPEPVIATRPDAERLLAAADARTADLALVLESETALLSAGRIRDALAAEARKTEIAASYLLALQVVKSNIVALKRLAPSALESLKAGQVRVGEIAARNQIVLATAKAVSESLVKGLADEVRRDAVPAGYAAKARPPAIPTTGPLVFSGCF